jgi:DNA-directed RNA polymerase specialized sigma subunit
VNWHYFGDLSFTDIARRFGVSGPRVFQLHTQALRRMRELLDEELGGKGAA